MKIGGIKPELNSIKIGDTVQAHVKSVGMAAVSGKMIPYRGPEWANFTIVDDKYTNVDFSQPSFVIAINRVNKMIKGGTLRTGWEL